MKLQEIAEYVDKTYQNKEEMDPITNQYPELSIEEAYQIQIMNAMKRKVHDPISGMKIGITSKMMQEVLQTDEPDFGHIYESRNITGNSISMKEFVNPKIEAEIAFVMKDSVDGNNFSDEDLINAIDYVIATFEIADARVKDWKYTLRDMIVDSAAFGAYKLGSVKMKLTDIDLVKENVTLEINGEVTANGSGEACLGNPLTAMKWLVKAMAKHDLALKAGDVILSGSLTPALPIKAGDVVKTQYSTLGSVELEFTE